jgi:hypothetical protein
MMGVTSRPSGVAEGPAVEDSPQSSQRWDNFGIRVLFKSRFEPLGPCVETCDGGARTPSLLVVLGPTGYYVPHGTRSDSKANEPDASRRPRVLRTGPPQK